MDQHQLIRLFWIEIWFILFNELRNFSTKKFPFKCSSCVMEHKTLFLYFFSASLSDISTSYSLHVFAIDIWIYFEEEFHKKNINISIGENAICLCYGPRFSFFLLNAIEFSSLYGSCYVHFPHIKFSRTFFHCAIDGNWKWLWMCSLCVHHPHWRWTLNTCQNEFLRQVNSLVMTVLLLSTIIISPSYKWIYL